ncbi:MAG: flagellar biosynthetic protein FliR [Bdellovibrionia bacterium]
MSLFQVNVPELLTFVAVLVRISVLYTVLPFIGDRVVAAPIKILFALATSVAIFPALVASGSVSVREAQVWSSSPAHLVLTLSLEVVLGLALGFVARLIFQGISIGANLAGNFMGFSAASQYDPHQESQSEIVAQVQTTLAMLLFLALDGHHLMVRAALRSYEIVGLGRAQLGGQFNQRLIQLSSQVIAFAIQMSAPVAVILFTVNVIFGILAKAVPQLNVMVISMGVSALVGRVVFFLHLPGFREDVVSLISQMGLWMEGTMQSMVPRS